MNEEGREAILREISLKQLRWLDWHTSSLCRPSPRESCSPSDLCGGCYGREAGCFSNVAVKRQCCQGHLKMCAPLHSSQPQSLGMSEPWVHQTPPNPQYPLQDAPLPQFQSSHSFKRLSTAIFEPRYGQHSSLVKSVL